MGNQSDPNNIAGWPKMITQTPERPHADVWEIFGTDTPDESDESDEPFDISNSSESRYGQTDNVYHVLTAFVKFHSLGLYPPPWVIDEVAKVFRKHLDNPDPELFATQFGVIGKGSGANNPYEEFTTGIERKAVTTEMVVLVNGFRISLSDAARAVIQRDGLDVTTKTLTNKFHERFGSPRPYMLKYRDYDPVHDPFMGIAENREGFISEFPRNVQKLLRQNMPDIT